jgi:hypothetical protein
MECTYCIRKGFPELDGMCHHHYRWLVCNSLRYGADRAEQEWSAALDRVYKVEVSLGLRPSPYEPALTPREITISNPRPRVNYPHHKDDDSEDFI